ncbi:MAG: MlaD family protein [Planctomycetaceae bacterium]|nr:MlaD family protein [Planctomycetaceae bacterium]
MNNERRLQFQVGLVVLIAMSIGTALVIRFGDLQKDLQQRYIVSVQLETAGGLYHGAPVLMSGLPIGHVAKIRFGEQIGVVADLGIRPEIQIKADSRPIVTRSLLGEAAIEFLPVRSAEVLVDGSEITGQGASDPLAAIQRLEGRAVQVLDSLAATTNEWQKVGANVNSLMTTNRGQVDHVIAGAAESLHELTQTLQTANKMIASANLVLGNPTTQQSLQETINGLPALVEDTRRTIAGSRMAIEGVHRNMVNLSQVTEPIGQRGEAMVAKLDSSLSSLEQLLGELNRFTQMVNKPNGTLQKFAADPALYDNLNRSSQSLAIILRNAEPLLKDFKEFSDKIARNPEVLGAGGVVRPSSGLRDSELLQPGTAKPSASRPTVRSQN